MSSFPEKSKQLLRVGLASGAAWSWACFPVPGCECEGIGKRAGCLKVTLLGIQTSKPDLQPRGLRAPPA